MQSQDELFADLVSATNPATECARFRVGRKIIEVPFSIYRNGRLRADLSRYGAGEVVSRNRHNFEQRIIGLLEKIFGDAIEAVREELKRKIPATSQPRMNNKLASRTAKAAGSREYINPFVQPWTFARCPHWLFSRREPSPTEKNVYAALQFPIPPGTPRERQICREFDQQRGLVAGLQQRKLAHELGVRREAINSALKSLERRGLIEVTGGQGVWGQDIRFLLHEWMPENTVTTCAVNAQVVDSKPVRSTGRTCAVATQELVRSPRRTCDEIAQVSQAIEKRETEREERESNSPSPFCSWAGEPHETAAELRRRREAPSQ